MNLKELRMTQPGMKWVSVHETFSPFPCKGLLWTKSCLSGWWVSSQIWESSSQLFSYLSPHPSPYVWALSSGATQIIPFYEKRRIYQFQGDMEGGLTLHHSPSNGKINFSKECSLKFSSRIAESFPMQFLHCWEMQVHFFFWYTSFTLKHHREFLNTLYGETAPYFSRGRDTHSDSLSKGGHLAGQVSLEGSW